MSMGLNFIGLGSSEGFLRGILYKEVEEKLVTGFVPSIKAYGQTIIDESLGKGNAWISTIAWAYLENIIINNIENFIYGD